MSATTLSEVGYAKQFVAGIVPKPGKEFATGKVRWNSLYNI